MSDELLCGVCGRAFNQSAVHMCVSAPPVSSELAEAQATIVRLHSALDEREFELAEAKGCLNQLEDDISEWRPIVEAATALVEHRGGSYSEFWSRHNDLMRAVAAVEEGARTDG